MGFNLPEIKGDMVFESFPAGPLQCNCSVIGDPLTKRGIIVDPGGDPEKISFFGFFLGWLAQQERGTSIGYLTQLATIALNADIPPAKCTEGGGYVLYFFLWYIYTSAMRTPPGSAHDDQVVASCFVVCTY